MEFIKSLVEDGKMVSYKGYFYRKDKTNQTTINWRCAVKFCKGRLTTTINAENGDVPARVGGEHLHAPDPMRIEVKKVHARVTEKAINTQEPPRRIIADEIQPLNQEAAWQLLSNRNLAVMINRKRKQFSSSEPAEANDAEVNKTYKSETIGIDGGILEHEACAVNFPKKSLDRTIHVSLCLQAHDNAWPTASYSRKSPIFSLTPSNAQFDSKKPVVTIPCWYVSMSSDEDHDGEIYVMQKCNEQWEPIHRESSQNQFVISCSLAQLSPIALARKRTERLMKTMLYLSDKGNFTAFFFHPDEIEKIRAERKVGRCTAMSQINSLNLKPSDDIALYFSRTCDPGRVMACFKAADIHGIKSVTFLGPTVKPNETRTDMRYQVKVNGESQVSYEFQANLQEPGRPDTSHSPRGPIVYNNTTNGIGGRMDYMTVDATPGTEWQ